MPADALDVINLLSRNNLANAEFVSNSISAGYQAASQGVRVASDIVGQITRSAADFKQTQVDEWYKTNSLRLRDKEIGIQQQQNEKEIGLKERYYTYLENKHESDLEFDREKQAESIKNKASYGAVNSHLAKLRGEQSSLQAQAAIYGNELKGLEDQLGKPHLYSSSEYSQLKLRKQHILGENDKIIKSLASVSAGYSNLEVTRDSLVNGLISPDDVNKQLGVGQDNSGMSPATTAPYYLRSSNSSGIPTGPTNTPVPASPISDLEVDAFRAVGEPDKWGLEDTIEATTRMFSQEGTANPFMIRSFVDQKSDQNTQDYFSSQRTGLQRKYFESLFDDLVLGPNAEQFKVNQERFAKQYAAVGGLPQELDSLRDKARFYYNGLKSADGNVAEQVRDIVNKEFNVEKKSKIKTGNSGVAVSDSGLLIQTEVDPSTGRIKIEADNPFAPRPTDSEEPYLRRVKDKDGKQFLRYESDKSAKDNEAVRDVFKKAITRDKNGKSTVSQWAVQTLQGMPAKVFGINVNTGGASQESGISFSRKKSDRDKKEEERQKYQRIQALVNGNRLHDIITLISNYDTQ